MPETYLRSIWGNEMTDRFLRWYKLRSTRQEFLDQVQYFSQNGIFLEHPYRKACIVLNVDGADVELRQSEIAHMVDLKIGNFDVEYWLTADVNVTCFYSWLPMSFEVQTYHLETLDSGQLERVTSVLIAHIETHAASTLGYVLDVKGRTADQDWNGFFDSLELNQLVQISAYPDILVLRGSIKRINDILQVPNFVSSSQVGNDFVKLENRLPRGGIHS